MLVPDTGEHYCPNRLFFFSTRFRLTIQHRMKFPGICCQPAPLSIQWQLPQVTSIFQKKSQTSNSTTWLDHILTIIFIRLWWHCAGHVCWQSLHHSLRHVRNSNLHLVHRQTGSSIPSPGHEVDQRYCYLCQVTAQTTSHVIRNSIFLIQSLSFRPARYAFRKELRRQMANLFAAVAHPVDLNPSVHQEMLEEKRWIKSKILAIAFHVRDLRITIVCDGSASLLLDPKSPNTCSNLWSEIWLKGASI